MKIQSHSRQYVGAANFEFLQISQNLAYYRYSFSVEPAERSDGPRLDGLVPSYQTKFGFAYVQDVQAYLQNTTSLAAITQKDIMYLSKESIDFLKINNFGEFLSQHQKSNSNLSPDEVWTQLVLGHITVEDLYIVDYSNYEVFDLNKQPIPVALDFDYMSGRMHNGCYDLDKAVEVLKQNSKVIPVSRYHYLKEQDLQIQTVPGYNACSEHTEYLSFKYAFDTEEYRKILNHTLSPKHAKLTGADKIYAAMLELDTLGLRAAGAVMIENYYDYVPVKNYREDDDDCHC